jgi:hypothetical protein
MALCFQYPITPPVAQGDLGSGEWTLTVLEIKINTPSNPNTTQYKILNFLTNQKDSCFSSCCQNKLIGQKNPENTA